MRRFTWADHQRWQQQHLALKCGYTRGQRRVRDPEQLRADIRLAVERWQAALASGRLIKLGPRRWRVA